MEERKKIELNIGWLASAVAVLLGLIALYNSITASHDKNLTDQIQDDSAYARATRACAWIDRNGWKYEHEFGPPAPPNLRHHTHE